MIENSKFFSMGYKIRIVIGDELQSIIARDKVS